MAQVTYQSLASRFATLGQACHACDTLKSPTNRLSKCAACKRVSYCGPSCQKADWPKHKPFCKAFRYALSSSSTTTILKMHPGSLMDHEMPDPSIMTTLLQFLSKSLLGDVQRSLGRPVNAVERDLVMHEPRCLACGRSESVMRIQAEKGSAIGTPTSLQQCEDCSFGFYCSKSHWDVVKYIHKEAPCPTGLNGLSQCATNKNVYDDLKFIHIRRSSKLGDYCWAPKRTKPQWTSLKGIGWDDFKDEFRQDHAGEVEQSREIKFRAATEGLAMPMTILWALEILNEDDSWTKKEMLTIHVIGALGKELGNADAFEEILHRLPEVKTLKLELINPELAIINPMYRRTTTVNMKTCADCTKRGRKWIHIVASNDYVTYVNKQKPFKNPDLAIAFDTGASEFSLELCTSYDEQTFPWMGPMKFLVSRKIPSVFTTYDDREATVEADMLKKAGADLHPLLGPRTNPWGSLLLRLEPCSVSAFYSHNGWLSGGFR